MIQIRPIKISKDNFKPFGDIIEYDNEKSFIINQRTTERFDSLATINVQYGHPIISLFKASPRKLPLEVQFLEKHPYGTQAFFPLNNCPWLVVVSNSTNPNSVICFSLKGNQGIQYNIDTWHYPLITLHKKQDFIVIDRDNSNENINVVKLKEKILINN